MMQVYDETKDDDTVFVPDRVNMRRGALSGVTAAVVYGSVLGAFLFLMWKLLRALI